MNVVDGKIRFYGTNVKENWMGNQERTIQRRRQHRAHKTQDEDKKTNRK